ncbi:DUF2634 domain-containing protein [Paenibacillus sp. KQZ6P-2]|uniref:DUF2634 domain-containing protein n=1 Tax=Paenibacillus mangrovi TaxID=2931978 RepID=A0A9X1WUD0_9BACL|nr:DUF2634 domain-containing protein [Paenibacillus mangrovi]MCJ8015219.1 DUF2634 domain-containing protein [Paenibacillus mangrovi]
MQSFKLEDGDLVFDSTGDLVMIEGELELAQCAEIALGTNTGEWFLNPGIGIDFGLFLGKNLNQEQMRDEIARGLLQDNRIVRVDEVILKQDKAERVQEITFKATANTGEVIQKEVKIGAD